MFAALSGWAVAGVALHLVGALGCLFAAVWIMRSGERTRADRGPTIMALLLTVLWSIASASIGSEAVLTNLCESARNLAWINVIYRLFQADGRHHDVKPVRPLVAALMFVEGLQIVLLLVQYRLGMMPGSGNAIGALRPFFHILVAVGALVLLHNLFAGASMVGRQMLRWSAGSLTAIWLYDLNLYTVAYLAGALPIELVALRGLTIAVAALGVAVSINAAGRHLRFRPSRAMTFRSLSLLVIGGYFLTMLAFAGLLDQAEGDLAKLTQAGFLFAAIALALYWWPSGRLRARLRMFAARHLFQHRYDYREEWLRFSRTIGDTTGATFEERIVRAVADIADSPAGVLLLPDDQSDFTVASHWRWDQEGMADFSLPIEFASKLECEPGVVDLDAARGHLDRRGSDTPIPGRLLDRREAWALVPLMHFDRLTGIVLLARPLVDRSLDWEDFDLLKVAGQQLASYLAERTTQQSLVEAARFDEFNRRMAFVMHDIKNLASQLTLLARNAEIHAERPDFRADMLITLRNSSIKLHTLLARLGRYGSSGRCEARPTDLPALCRRVAGKFSDRRVEYVGHGDVFAQADETSLEQALDHLVQNAIEASDPRCPVIIELSSDLSSACIQIVDSGTGMSPDFVRRGLFKPFVSSKEGGFGIGAYEAREHIRAMGGRLDVDTREGLGSRFVVRLPVTRGASNPRAHPGSDKEVA